MRPTDPDLAALLYPGAEVLDQVESERSYNLLLGTADEAARVWGWYARRVRCGRGAAAVGRHHPDPGTDPLAMRCSLRVPSPAYPLGAGECPMVVTARQGKRTVTVLVARAPGGGATQVVLFVLNEW